MNMQSVSLKFITPGFCTGANQSRAELRPASIRGQLRWWFRVLGGTAEEEKAVFGGVHGNFGEDSDRGTRNVARASAVTVRVTACSPVHDEQSLPRLRMNEPLYYLLHFAKVSGRPDGQQHGPRVAQDAFFAPGTTFDLALFTSRPLSGALQTKLEKAVEAFRTLGHLGLRGTRGMGAWCESGDLPDLAAFGQRTTACRAHVRTVYACTPAGPMYCHDWQSCAYVLESLLRKLRKRYPAGKLGTAPGPLGRGGNERQASAVHLRPVLLKDGFLPVAYYAESVLGPASRVPDFPLGGMLFEHPWGKPDAATVGVEEISKFV